MSSPDKGISLENQPKTMRLWDMVLFAVSALVAADVVASSAAIGVQGLTLWILLAVVFFLPYGLLTAELGSAWPGEGGLYVWVREAFGQRWATMTAWLYWVNVAYWAPSVFVLFTGTLITVFAPGLSRFWEVVIVLAMIWVIVGIGILPISWSKWVPTVTAVLKVIVLASLGVMGVAYIVRHGSANPFSGSEWMPSWGANFAFVPVIIYSFMGFELINSPGSAIKHPRRDIPRAITLAGVITLGIYLFAIFGLLASLKLDDISIVTGVADALKLSFEQVLPGGDLLYQIVVVALLLTFVGNMVTWSIGANHSMAATGLDMTAPGVFGHVNRRFKSPDYAFLLLGLIGSALALFDYGFFGSREDVFWTIFAMGSIVFLLPYLLMFPALVILRRKHPEVPRPYSVPGGAAGAWICTCLCEGGVLLALVLFFTEVPEGTPRGMYWAVTAGGTALTVFVGWLLLRHAERREARAGDIGAGGVAAVGAAVGDPVRTVTEPAAPAGAAGGAGGAA